MLKFKDSDKEEKESIIKEEVELKIEEELENTEEILLKASKKVKKKQCKILFVAKGRAMVSMFEQNFRIINKDDKKAGDIIEIKYVGTFGKEDFSIVND